MNKRKPEKKCNCICHHSPGVQICKGMKEKCRHCRPTQPKKITELKKEFYKQDLSHLAENWTEDDLWKWIEDKFNQLDK